MPDIIGRPVSLCVPGQRLRQVRQRHRRVFPRPDSHIQERGWQKGNHRWSATINDAHAPTPRILRQVWQHEKRQGTQDEQAHRTVHLENG